MNSKTGLAIGLAACGCMIAAGAAQAGQMVLGSTGKHAAVPVYQFVHPDKSVFPTTDSAHVRLDKLTMIDRWALIDEINCVELGVEQPFVFPAVPQGTFSSGIESAQLGDGNCPGVDFNFAEVDFTWTDRGAPMGAKFDARGRSLITGIDKRTYGISKAVIVDKVHIKFTGR